jgi:hypothetical protein
MLSWALGITANRDTVIRDTTNIKAIKLYTNVIETIMDIHGH